MNGVRFLFFMMVVNLRFPLRFFYNFPTRHTMKNERDESVLKKEKNKIHNKDEENRKVFDEKTTL